MRAIFLTFLTWMVLSVSAFTQEGPPHPASRTLALSATSEMKVAPNLAYLTIAVTTQAAVASEAVKHNATQMKAVVEALQKLLGAPGKLQTGNYQVSPSYQYDEATRKQVLKGYEVNNQVRVQTTDLNNIGNLIDVAVKAGSNQIQSLQFSRTDMDELVTEATVTAIQKAKSDAAKMAQAAGVALGSIQQISTGNGPGPGPLYKEMRMMNASADMGTPVVPGEISVTGTVSMVFAIN